MSRRKPEEHENHERWLVSYADFITLLFAFFVVLYATSTRNEEKERKFEDAIRAKFNLIGSIGELKTSGGINYGNVIEPLDPFQKKSDNQELVDYIERLLEKSMTPEERKQAISGIRHDSIGVRISLAASTFFESGAAKIKGSALKSLDRIADVLKKSPNTLIIEGHTDDTPVVGGQYESNWELASLRATSVVEYLIKNHAIDPKRLAAISYADQRPLVDNTTEENKSKNRRIEILILNGEAPAD